MKQTICRFPIPKMKIVLSVIVLLFLNINKHARAAVPDSLEVRLTADSLYGVFDRAWWKYVVSDDSSMSTLSYDDRDWKVIHTEDIDSTVFSGVGWFRLHFKIDSSLVHKPIALQVRQKGASEIYLDGKLIKQFGRIKGKDSTVYFDPQNVPVIIVLDSVGEHLVAVRYARYHYMDGGVGFSIQMEKADAAVERKRMNDLAITIFLMVLFVVFLTLAFLHILFFLYYKQNISNLFFSLFMFCIAGIWLSVYWFSFTSDPDWAETLCKAIVVFAAVASASFVFFIHIIFNNKGKWWMIIALLLSALMLIAYFLKSTQTGPILTILLSYVSVYSFASLLMAIIRKIKGALILGIGFGFFLLSLFAVIMLAILVGGVELNTENSVLGQILVVVLLLDIVCIPVTMSVYQAWMFAKLNKDLTNQLQQVKELSETTIRQEQEKKQLLENQNAQLEVMVTERTAQLSTEKHKSDMLLLNILPEGVAEELKNTGRAQAKQHNNVSVLFTDFVNFTGLSETMTPTELVQEIHRSFTVFDSIIEKHGLEKIKTIGDAYMAVCGLPEELPDHAQRVVKAALEIKQFMETSDNRFRIRIGIHSGPVVAGIVGVKKYAYDIWGDTVNTAARMEQNSESGKINISGTTYELVKREFTCEYRGKISVKNKGEIDMYFVNQQT